MCSIYLCAGVWERELMTAGARECTKDRVRVCVSVVVSEWKRYGGSSLLMRRGTVWVSVSARVFPRVFSILWVRDSFN